MMDPITALSLASNVVQFVDFGSRLVADSLEIYRQQQGTLQKHLDLEYIADSLIAYSETLEKELFPLSGCLTQEEQILDDLRTKCNGIAKDLLSRLENYKIKKATRKRGLRSFQVGVKVLWTKRELEEISERLNIFRRELESRLFHSFRHKFDLISIQQDARFDSLDANIQRLTAALFQGNTIVVDTIIKRMEELERIQIEKQRETQSRSLSNEQRSVQNGDAASWLLESLRFDTIDNRYDDIVDAHKKTFEWIFQDPKAEGKLWTNFVHWLRKGKGIYWINGKAGSGKSTLMRFIYNHPRTTKELQLWAKKTRLCVAGFFFWSSGSSPLQMSQIGLLRALLYEDRRRTQASFGEITVASESWTISKLNKAFKNLITQKAFSIKICFLIDGLDEYNGDHHEIVSQFKAVVASLNVKVCLSSRPLVVFEDALRKQPGLRLQDLTDSDIRRYVNDKLNKDKKMLQLTRREPKTAPELTTAIVTKANGVFLWVVLVVRSLLTGLRNQDRIHDLQQRLLLLPKGLDELYEHMMTKIEPEIYVDQAARIFHTVRAARGPVNLWSLPGKPISFESLHDVEPLTVFALAQALEPDLTLAIRTDISQLSDEQLSSKCKELDCHLRSRCAGLLEIQYQNDEYYDHTSENVQPNWRVQYIHRTAKDFIEESPAGKKLLQAVEESGFDPHLALLRSALLQLKLLISPIPGPENNQQMWEVITTGLFHAREAGYYQAQVALLDELDRTVQQHWKTVGEGIVENHWGCAVFMQGSNTLSPEGSRDNFASTVVQFGLAGYVKHKMVQDRHFITSKAGRPLLDYAVNPAPLYVNPVSMSPETVSILLKYGANPNQKSEGSSQASPWQNALAYLDRHVTGITDSSHLRGHIDLEKWGEILSLFLSYGADRNLPSLGSEETTGQLLERHLPSFPAEQAEKLQMLLAGKHTQTCFHATEMSRNLEANVAPRTGHNFQPSAELMVVEQVGEEVAEAVIIVDRPKQVLLARLVPHFLFSCLFKD